MKKKSFCFFYTHDIDFTWIEINSTHLRPNEDWRAKSPEWFCKV